MGYTHEEILEELPHLGLETIDDALSYYNAHKKEIVVYIAPNSVLDHLTHPNLRDK